MTTSRIVRGTKGRLFIYICAVLFIVGIIACYNNTRTQLDDVLKTHEICRQQQENLSTQLQVIFDYKQRLEKSLKTEKAEHQQSRSDLDAKLNEERNRNDKVMKEENVRFDTLQQHYNILQTQHDDFKEECSKIQHEQNDEVNKLQAKLKEVQEQLKKSEADKIKTIGHLKVRITQLQDENAHLLSKLTATKNDKVLIIPPNQHAGIKDPERQQPTFSKQVKVSDGHYNIVADTNVGDSPINQAFHVPSPLQQQHHDRNEQQQPVLPAPVNAPAAGNRSSTPTSLVRDRMGPQPLAVPSGTPETLKRRTSEEIKLNGDLRPMGHAKAQIPFGVVPEPPLYAIEQQGDIGSDGLNVPMVVDSNVAGDTFVAANNIAVPDDGGINEDMNAALNNRYRGNIIDTAKRAEALNQMAGPPAIADDAKENVNDVDGGANALFGDNMMDNNNGAKLSNEKNNHHHHIDHLGVAAEFDDAQEKEDLQGNDLNLDPNEDDDADDVMNHIDPAVRN